MTHDELLAKIEDSEVDMCDIMACAGGECKLVHKIYKVLRAVVELHKEVTLITGYSHDKTYELRQQVCVNCTDLAGKPIPYPCFNVQAIEKELK